MFSLRRQVSCLFPTLVALLASLIAISTKYKLPFPNPLKLWLPPSTSAHVDNQFGLFLFAPGIDPKVDIVAIHGLDGHFNDSWTAANGKLWLQDFLPHKIPHARIMSYGYDAYTRNRKQLSTMTIYDHAETLVAALASKRQETDTERRPIIFVAHSLGGIVLKYAMVHAHAASKDNKFHHKAIELSTYGINYLGTPHQGTDSADLANLLLGIQSIYADTNDAVLRDLIPNSPALQQQLSQYSSISGRYKTKFFFETYDTLLLGGIKKRLVPKSSAVVPGATDAESIALYKDHVGISKFESESDGDFQTLTSHLINMVNAAPSKISQRWASYDRHEEIDQKEKAGIEIMSSVDIEALNKLPYANGASYNSKKGCLPGTRIALVDGILGWIRAVNQTQGAEIYFLTGGAGVGKTSIAHTIAQRCEEERLLMSSFFFDGQIAERNRPAMLFSTMARDLAERDTAFRRHIVQSLEETRSLAGASIAVHFTELILKASRSLREEESVVMIIDALDEGRPDEARQALQVLRADVPKLPRNFRILITARTTPDIQFDLFHKTHVRTLSLNTDDKDNLDDVAMYSQHALRDIAIRKGLGDDWPNPLLLKDFISRSGGLFIWVSTVYEVLRSSINPDNQLKSLVSIHLPPDISPEKIMDQLYLTILQKCTWEDDDFIHGYHSIVGAIMAAKTPLSMSALQSLHRHIINFPVQNLLAELASLFPTVTAENIPVQILHQSLKDFITVRAQSTPGGAAFYLSETQHSQRLGLLCIVVMNEDLPQFRLAMGYLANEPDWEPKGIPQIAADLVSPQLLYACEFWMDHLVTIEQPTRELIDALQTFLSTRLVRWMELCTSTGQYKGLSRLRVWLKREISGNGGIANAITNERTARSLFRLSERLVHMGRQEEALKAIEDSVGLYRALANIHPKEFNSPLAWALDSLASRFSDLGHREEALLAVREAVKLYRSLAKAQPNEFNSDLALALNTLATSLLRLGHREKALEAIEEAAGLYRPLAMTYPYEYNPGLADSLHNLDLTLSELGRQEEGLKASMEAARLYRILARARPNVFNPNLARSMNRVGFGLARLGYRKEALTAVEEAVRLYRPLARERPNTFNPSLAISLNNLANRLLDLGRSRREALEILEEAITLYRPLVTARPRAFSWDFADALNDLGLVLAELGRREEALTAVEEAVALFRALANAHPDANNPDLAWCLGTLSRRFSALGRRDEALKAAEEAVHLYRPFATAHPKAFNQHLERNLKNLAESLSAVGREEEAESARKEAVELHT